MARRFSKSFMLAARAVHIYVSMLTLLVVLFFSFTGFLLNHPSWFNLDKLVTRTSEITLPEDVAATSDKLVLVEHLRAEAGARGAVKSFSQTDESSEVRFVAPGRNMEFIINRLNGETTVREEVGNVLLVMGDLHKAQHTGAAWSFIVDATAWLLIVVSVTGLLLWTVLAKRRTIGLIALALGVVGTVGVYLWLMP